MDIALFIIGYALMCAASACIGVMIAKWGEWRAEDDYNRRIVVDGRHIRLPRTLWQAI